MGSFSQPELLALLKVVVLIFMIVIACIALSVRQIEMINNSKDNYYAIFESKRNGVEIKTKDIKNCRIFKERFLTAGGLTIIAIAFYFLMLLITVAKIKFATVLRVLPASKKLIVDGAYHSLNFVSFVFIMVSWALVVAFYHKDWCQNQKPVDQGHRLGLGAALLIITWLAQIFALLLEFLGTRENGWKNLMTGLRVVLSLFLALGTAVAAWEEQISNTARPQTFVTFWGITENGEFIKRDRLQCNQLRRSLKAGGGLSVAAWALYVLSFLFSLALLKTSSKILAAVDGAVQFIAWVFVVACFCISANMLHAEWCGTFNPSDESYEIGTGCILFCAVWVLHLFERVLFLVTKCYVPAETIAVPEAKAEKEAAPLPNEPTAEGASVSSEPTAESAPVADQKNEPSAVEAVPEAAAPAAAPAEDAPAVEAPAEETA